MKKNTDVVTIETPEHMQLELQLAGIGTRSIAFILDRLLQYGLVFAIITFPLLVIALMGDILAFHDWVDGLRRSLGLWILAIVALIYGVIMIGYFILFEYLWSGSTPGKRTQKIRVVRTDGRPITLVDSAVRNILRFADLFAEVYPLGLAVMFLDSKNRRLGDALQEEKDRRSKDSQRIEELEDQIEESGRSIRKHEAKRSVRHRVRKENINKAEDIIDQLEDIGDDDVDRIVRESNASSSSDPDKLVNRVQRHVGGNGKRSPVFEDNSASARNLSENAPFKFDVGEIRRIIKSSN